MLKIGICDDNKLFAATLEEELVHISKQKNIQLEIEVFFDGKELIRYHLGGNLLNILFLDLQMKDIHGLEAAKTIRKSDAGMLIIFCSSYVDQLIELFEIEPFRFLKKPLDFSELLTVFEKAYDRIIQQGKYFEFTFNKEIIRLPIQTIYYFESSGRRIYVHTTTGRYEFNGKLSQVENSLKSASIAFLRIHQSYLINFKQLKMINYTTTVLQNNVSLPISPNRQKEIRQKYAFLLSGE